MQGLNISSLIPWRRLAFLIISILLLVWFIYNRDASLVGEFVLDGVVIFPIVLLISFFFQFLQALAWQLAVGPSKGSFWSLFTLEVGGNALRSLSPFTLVGGDPVQGHQLQKKHEVVSGADSIVTDRAVQYLATGIFVWVALIVGFLRTPSLPIAVRIAVSAVVAALGIYCIIAVRNAKSGFYGAIISKIPTFGLPCGCNSPATVGTTDEMDRQIINFYEKKSGAFYQSLILHLICQVLLLVEVYLIGSALLRAEFTVSWALILTGLAPVVSTIFCFIPGAFAVMEMSFAGLLALAFGPMAAVAGIAIVLIRRVRALCWIIVGLIFAGNPFKMFLGK
jgi:uncharacterized membrane protein YbhN (UPF0104 family)